MAIITRITHWLPIITFCPVNKLPDLIFVSIEFDHFMELYSVRRQIKGILQFKCLFMEDCAEVLATAFPTASFIEVSLIFNRHTVKLSK